MTETQRVYRCFHPLIINAYTSVHQWIETSVQDADGYKSLTYSNLKQKLQETDWKHIAFQYYALFPAHYFKAAYMLDSVIGEEQIITWLRHRQKFCILDIGCGAGAASAAFLEIVIRLKEQGKLTNEVNILFIGVDPSHRAIGLYKKTMENLKSSTENLINLDFKHVIEGFPNAINPINRYLKDELLSFQTPCLSNVLVMQLNVISPFSQTYRNCQENLEELRALGIDIDESTAENDVGLGTAEAQAYKQLIENVPIDIMHIVTIGTKNMEKQVQVGTNSEITLEERIKEMVNTLQQVVGNRHTINQINSDNHTVYFENPPNCYWIEQKNVVQYSTEFYADFQTVYSADREEDKEWNEVINLDNLRLAWARARNNFLRETLCDETEMRLFDLSLEVRLGELREQLCAYASDVALTDEMISYRVPKNFSVSRPKGLSRIEEEILSVAIIQKLGDKASQLRGSSYAYRISGKSGIRGTEYLYEYWFQAYCYYIKKARDSASRYPNGVILRVDIESFYTKIIQDQLCNELSKELTVSERVRWLIRLLLSKEIDEHELGQGITQGSVGSGFYANIYLTSVDAKFGSSNEWGVELHRYVDDMILIIPNSQDMDVIESTLKEELRNLGLNLNETKTEKIFDIALFLGQSDEDECLEKLSDQFDSIVNPLWILNSEHRAIFASSYHNDDLWWYYIGQYQQCLRTLKIHTHETDLSRKIYKYLFSERSRERDLLKQKKSLDWKAN
jgi:SAM-dependent methyltransferase